MAPSGDRSLGLLTAEDRTALASLASAPRRVLAVFPHPDDESYGAAGTLARLASDEDTAVVLITLTSGEAAQVGRDRGIAPADLAALREDRMHRVAAWLGLDRVLLPRLPDGALDRLPLAAFTASLREVVEVLRPVLILGHDPRGVNGHPDHIASHWALRGALADGPVRRFAMFAHDAESVASVAPRLLFETPGARLHHTVRLSEDEIAVKERCLIEHEAIVTLDARRARREELILRPPKEQWEFYGEADGVRFASLFEAMPEGPPVV